MTDKPLSPHGTHSPTPEQILEAVKGLDASKNLSARAKIAATIFLRDIPNGK